MAFELFLYNHRMLGGFNLKAKLIMVNILAGLSSNVKVGPDIRKSMYDDDKVWTWLIFETSESEDGAVYNVYMIGQQGKHENRAIVKEINKYSGVTEVYSSRIKDDTFDEDSEKLIDNISKDEKCNLWAYVTF